MRWCFSGVDDVRRHVGARVPRAGDVDRRIAPRASRHPAGVSLRRSLDKDLVSLPHPRRISLLGDAVLQRDEAIKPLLDHVLGDLIVVLGSGCARARRVLEHECGVEASHCDRVERRLEVFLGLPREPHDDVGRDGEVTDDLPGHAELGQEPLGVVAAVHRRKDAGAPRLQGEVQLLTDRRRLGHRIHHVFADVLGVGARVANTTQTVDLADLTQQICEQRLPAVEVEVSPVAVDVLAQQRDFGHAIGDETTHFVDDVAGADG